MGNTLSIMKQKSKHRFNPRNFIIAGIVLALAALSIISMAVSASVVQLRRATAVVPDLPEAFEGVTILYLSDIDLCGLNTPARSAELINRLQSLAPDMLILGGDYTSPTLWEFLNGSDSGDRQRIDRDRFFEALANFTAPMGKYALTVQSDRALGDMTSLLEKCGFLCLNNTRRSLEKRGQRLWLVGADAESNYTAAGKLFNKKECVLCAVESPDCLPRIATAEAADGGQWADLCLTGSTHGGQICVFGRSILGLTPLQQQYLYGWTTENGVPTLTTSGLGCELLNLRLATAPEAWLLACSARGQ